MIILFTLDGENVELKFPLSCDAATTVRQAVAALRAKLRAAASVTIDVRTHQGLPVPLTDTVGTVKERLAREKGNATKSFVELYALLDGPQKAVRQCMLAAVHGRKCENPSISEEIGSSSEEEPEEDYRRFTSDEDYRLMRAGGGTASSSSSPPAPTSVPGLHFIRINGKFQKGYALSDVAWGAPIATEVPTMSLAYSTQLGEAVANSEKLRSRTYDPSFSAGESTMRGVDAEDFSKYVSIARTHGHLIKTSDKYGSRVALYPEISCLRHSCSPNAVFRRAIVKPYRGVVRCAQTGGSQAGDEVTVLLPSVNTLLFMLLPRERRQRLLQERYHFTCDCARCWREEDAAELTLSGAYFAGEAKSNAALQKRLTAEMREEFEALHIFNNTSDPSVPIDTPVGSKIPKSPHALLSFVFKYTAPDALLRLHRNHWRVSVVRVAYLKQAAFVLSAQSKERTVPVRPFLEQRSFEMALQQLTTEALFVPKGHPYYASSFAIYKKMMAILPTKLVAALQAKSRRYAVDWDALGASFHMWEGAKGATVVGGDLSGTAPDVRGRPSATTASSAAGSSSATRRKRPAGGGNKSKATKGGDPLDSSFSSDGEPVIPEEMRRQHVELYGEAYVAAREAAAAAEDEALANDEEREANVVPFVGQTDEQKENLFVARERAEAEEAAFLAEHAEEGEEEEEGDGVEANAEAENDGEDEE